MGDLVNLRLVRKRRARAERAAEADSNRLAFGRSKAEVRLHETEARRQSKALDARRIDLDGRG